MRKRLLFIILCTCSVMMARGQAQIYLHCLEVLDNGAVSLSWNQEGGAPNFAECRIYYRIPPGNFSLAATISDYNTTQYVHNIAAANQQAVEYYLVTERWAPLPPILSDTLSTMHLSVTLNSSDPLVAALNWNALHDPVHPASSLYYRVSVNGVLTNFSLLDSTMLTHFEMPVTVCSDTLSFRIEIDDDNGCTSVSNMATMYFDDITPPSMPVLDSVSINPFTEDVILGWSQSSAGDAGGYQIYVIDVINDTLDPVFGAGNTFYIDDSFDPCAEYRTYAISAFDTCGNISPGTYDIPQRTILLSEVDFDPCTMVNTLDWTAYINMSPALAGYRVYLSLDGQPFELLASLPGTTSLYEHQGLDASHSYRYFIRAFSANDEVTSSSCIRELTTWQYLQPIENRMENASVLNSESVNLTLLPDTFAFVPMLNLYRSEEESGPYELLAELELDGSEVLYYEDPTAEVNSRSYYYYSTLVDSCGNEVLVTDHMRTIFLQGVRSGLVNTLEWNAFEGWPVSVAAYEVYRAVNSDGSFDLAGTLTGNTMDFQDDISSIPGEYSMLRYVVRALQDDDASIFSWSNEIILEYTPNVYLPNAFRPGGQNPVFKPVGNFADFSEYRLDVYNRWGELIFSSQDFGRGWDGSHKGGDAPGGVYVCILTYRSENGASATMKSTFVLLR